MTRTIALLFTFLLAVSVSPAADAPSPMTIYQTWTYRDIFKSKVDLAGHRVLAISPDGYYVQWEPQLELNTVQDLGRRVVISPDGVSTEMYLFQHRKTTTLDPLRIKDYNGAKDSASCVPTTEKLVAEEKLFGLNVVHTSRTIPSSEGGTVVFDVWRLPARGCLMVQSKSTNFNSEGQVSGWLGNELTGVNFGPLNKDLISIPDGLEETSPNEIQHLYWLRQFGAESRIPPCGKGNPATDAWYEKAHAAAVKAIQSRQVGSR